MCTTLSHVIFRGKHLNLAEMSEAFDIRPTCRPITTHARIEKIGEDREEEEVQEENREEEEDRGGGGMGKGGGRGG